MQNLDTEDMVTEHPKINAHLHFSAIIRIFVFEQNQTIDISKIRKPIRRDHLTADRILKRLGFGQLPNAKPVAGHWYRSSFDVTKG